MDTGQADMGNQQGNRQGDKGTNKGTDRGDLAKLQGRRQGSNRGASTEQGETGKDPTKLGIKRNGAQTQKNTLVTSFLILVLTPTILCAP